MKEENSKQPELPQALCQSLRAQIHWVLSHAKSYLVTSERTWGILLESQTSLWCSAWAPSWCQLPTKPSEGWIHPYHCCWPPWVVIALWVPRPSQVHWSFHYQSNSLRHSSVPLCAVLSPLGPEVPQLCCHEPPSRWKLLFGLCLQPSPKGSDEVWGPCGITHAWNIQHPLLRLPHSHLFPGIQLPLWASLSCPYKFILAERHRLATCPPNSADTS